MRLLGVELSRFCSRRAVVLLLLSAALLTALLAGTTLWNTRPVGATELAEARAQVREQMSQPAFQRDLQTCRDDPEDFFGPGTDAADCDANLVPRPENYLNRASLDLRQEARGTGIAVVVLVSALMILVGTTYAGADWATGSMSNQLLFEPRRLRVWATKALTAFLVCGVVAGVLLGAFWVALSLTADARGIATATPVLEQIRWMTARGVALARPRRARRLRADHAAAAHGRHPRAALRVRRRRRGPARDRCRWTGPRGSARATTCSPGSATASGSTTRASCAGRARPPSCDQRITISLLDGATYLGVLLVVTLLVSALVFRRRDVP